VVFIETVFASFDDVMKRAPDELARHRTHSAAMHDRGDVLMAGAFVEEAGPLSTMAICRSREAAEEFIDGDPFVVAGLTARASIRAWADMFGGTAAGPART
jgi:uncharacterized protein